MGLTSVSEAGSYRRMRPLPPGGLHASNLGYVLASRQQALNAALMDTGACCVSASCAPSAPELPRPPPQDCRRRLISTRTSTAELKHLLTSAKLGCADTCLAWFWSSNLIFRQAFRTGQPSLHLSPTASLFFQDSTFLQAGTRRYIQAWFKREQSTPITLEHKAGGPSLTGLPRMA